MAEIIVMLDQAEMERYAFDGDEIEIGRGDGNDIRLKNLGVSRRHSRIVREHDDWFVEDLGSANGTWLNGKRISRAQLCHGDQIEIGKHTMVFRLPRKGAEGRYDDVQETVVMKAGPRPAASGPMEETGPQEPFDEREAEAAEAEAGPILRVRSVGIKDVEFAVKGDAARIGRSPDNDVRLLDWFVDLYQARVSLDGGRWVLRNLSKANPTLLNGQAVEESVLRDGDKIQIGISRLVFEGAGEFEEVGEALTPEALEEAELAEPELTAPEPELPEPEESAPPMDESAENAEYGECVGTGLVEGLDSVDLIDPMDQIDGVGRVNGADLSDEPDLSDESVFSDSSDSSDSSDQSPSPAPDLPPDLARRVALLEKALENPSAAVRRHAADQLQKLTGREYDH
jgi:pSer/pThr/pTyr-binding forkhead associated (FHA) protein